MTKKLDKFYLVEDDSEFLCVKQMSKSNRDRVTEIEFDESSLSDRLLV